MAASKTLASVIEKYRTEASNRNIEQNELNRRAGILVHNGPRQVQEALIKWSSDLRKQGMILQLITEDFGGKSIGRHFEVMLANTGPLQPNPKFPRLKVALNADGNATAYSSVAGFGERAVLFDSSDATFQISSVLLDYIEACLLSLIPKLA